jgi:hypothetical protein
MEQTLEQLGLELNRVYGSIAGSIFNYYCHVDPLIRADAERVNYWENVRILLTELHQVLYKRDHPYSIDRINTENYYTLCKMVVDRSLSICDMIVMKDRKQCKTLANEISHNVLPLYIFYLRQITDKTGPVPPVIIKGSPNNQGQQQGTQPYTYGPPYTYGMPPYTYGMPPYTYGMPPYTYGMPPYTYGVSAPGMSPYTYGMSPPGLAPYGMSVQYFNTTKAPEPQKIRPRPRCVRRAALPRCIPIPNDDEDTFPTGALSFYNSASDICQPPKIMPVQTSVQTPCDTI